jgi:hypothetical protein
MHAMFQMENIKGKKDQLEELGMNGRKTQKGNYINRL